MRVNVATLPAACVSNGRKRDPPGAPGNKDEDFCKSGSRGGPARRKQLGGFREPRLVESAVPPPHHTPAHSLPPEASPLQHDAAGSKGARAPGLSDNAYNSKTDTGHLNTLLTCASTACCWLRMCLRMCVHACGDMCTQVYPCVYACECVYAHVCAHTCGTCACVCTCVHSVPVHVCMFMHACRDIALWVCACVLACTRMCVCMYAEDVHVAMHVSVCVYVHVCACVLGCTCMWDPCMCVHACAGMCIHTEI